VVYSIILTRSFIDCSSFFFAALTGDTRRASPHSVRKIEDGKEKKEEKIGGNFAIAEIRQVLD